jgi:N-acylneuraminate cytidylyltransferase
MTLAIIPARGGSKRIINKNIVDFLGRPIIYYVLDTLKKCEFIREIHVSTDSNEVKATVEDYGLPIQFNRPPELGSDETPILRVVQWVHNQYVDKGFDFDNILLIMPCSPLLTEEDLRKACAAFVDREYDLPLLSIVACSTPLERAFFKEEDHSLRGITPLNLSRRTQDLARYYFDAGNFCFFSKEQLVSIGDESFTKFWGYEIPSSRAIDIDDPNDLELAKVLYLGNKEYKKLL